MKTLAETKRLLMDLIRFMNLRGVSLTVLDSMVEIGGATGVKVTWEAPSQFRDCWRVWVGSDMIDLWEV